MMGGEVESYVYSVRRVGGLPGGCERGGGVLCLVRRGLAVCMVGGEVES
jgi:hypothetical protein